MSAPLLQKHPEYEEKFAEWDLCTKLFDGKHEIVCGDTSILWPMAVEVPQVQSDETTSIGKLLSNIAKDQWSRRSLRTRWMNYPEIISSLLISFIFRKCPDFQAVEELFGDQIKNVDGKGNSLFTFMKNGFGLDYLKYGKAIIKVESSKHSAATKADEIGAKIRPYFTSINPMAVPDWELADGDKITNYAWLRYEYARMQNRTSAESQPKKQLVSKAYYKEASGVRVDVYTADLDKNADTSNPQWAKQGSVPLNLSRIPFVVLEDVSWLKDVNQEALRYHNLRSSSDNILYSSGYQKVVVFGVDPSDPAQLQSMSESTWNLVRAADGSLQVVEPPDLSSHEKAQEQSVNNMFKVGLNQFHIIPADSRVGQSAEAQVEQKDNTAALIESLLEDIENGINDAIGLWAEYKGVSDYQEKIVLEKDFTKDDITQFITVYNSFRDQFAKYPDVEQMVVKKATKNLGLDDQDQEDALKAIDAGPTDPVQEDPLSDAKA